MVSLCNHPNRCCPKLEQVGDNVFRIYDDIGKEVFLTRTELLILYRRIENFKKFEEVQFVKEGQSEK